MATNRWLQLTPRILANYQWNNSGSPELTLDTDTNDNGRIYILSNPYTNGNHFFNESAADGVTNNIQGRQLVPIQEDRSRWASLTQQVTLNYLDYDSNFITLNQLQNQLTSNINSPVKTIEYENIQIYIASSFVFNDEIKGLLAEVGFYDKNGNFHSLTSSRWMHWDVWHDPASTNITAGGRNYPQKLNLWVPSVNKLANDWRTSPNDTDSLPYQLTDGNGLALTTQIVIRLYYITNEEKVDGQVYYDTTLAHENFLDSNDPFQSLSVRLEQATDGDYFLISGDVTGSNTTFEDFISGLESETGGNVTVLHEILIEEQISTNWFEVDNITRLQTSDFNEPMRFRPVLPNAHVSISFRINYTLRVIEQATGGQTIRTGQLINNKPNKYGKKLNRLKLNQALEPKRIYNLTTGGVQNTSLFNPPETQQRVQEIVRTKETIIDRWNVAINNITQGNNLETVQNADRSIWLQGEAIIFIPLTGIKLKFKLWQVDNNNRTPVNPIDLSGQNPYIIFWGQNQENNISIRSIDEFNTDKTSGEVAFNISGELAGRIQQLNQRQFAIVQAANNVQDGNVLYYGTWTSNNDEVSDNFYQAEINRLQEQNSSLESELNETINDFQSERQRLENRILELEVQLGQTTSNGTSNGTQQQRQNRITSVRNLNI